MEMRIEVVITDGASDGKTGKQEYRANVQADLPESGEKLVDEVERGILQLAAAFPLEGMSRGTPDYGAAHSTAKAPQAAGRLKEREQPTPCSVSETDRSSSSEAAMGASGNPLELKATFCTPTRQFSVAP